MSHCAVVMTFLLLVSSCDTLEDFESYFISVILNLSNLSSLSLGDERS